jgi:hypothetical protein
MTPQIGRLLDFSKAHAVDLAIYCTVLTSLEIRTPRSPVTPGFMYAVGTVRMLPEVDGDSTLRG